MAVPGSVEAFMEAEEEANRLVEELTRLKAETESYRTARSALEEAGTGVGQLATELADASERLDGVIQTLRSIGTPELLRAQEAAAAELARLRADFAESHRALDASVDAQRELLDAATRQLRAQEAAAAEVARLRADLAESRRALTASVDAQRESLDAATRELRTSVDSAARGVGSLRGPVLGVLVGLVGLGILIVMVATP